MRRLIIAPVRSKRTYLYVQRARGRAIKWLVKNLNADITPNTKNKLLSLHTKIDIQGNRNPGPDQTKSDQGLSQQSSRSEFWAFWPQKMPASG